MTDHNEDAPLDDLEKLAQMKEDLFKTFKLRATFIERYNNTNATGRFNCSQNMVDLSQAIVAVMQEERMQKHKHASKKGPAALPAPLQTR